MAQTVGYANAFTAGEIGENAWERSDLQQRAQGVAAGLNMVGLVVGPQVSRKGFWDRGAAIHQATRSRVVGFARSSAEALFLELGDHVARVWTPSGDPVLLAGVAYSFTTPWSADQNFGLFFKQIGDVLYVTDLSGGRTRTIQRRADNDWVVADFDFRDGPWLSENPDGPTLTFTEADPNLSISASAPVFTPADVGVAIRYREGDGNPGLNTWTAGTDYTVGVSVQFDGRVYRRVDAGGTAKSGTTPPLHQSGTVNDGRLDWAFVHDGAGIMQVIEYHSPTSVTCAPIRNGPGMTTSAYWAKAAYSNIQGWPRALAEEREERLVFAASRVQPGSVDMTRTNGFGPGYGDFKPGLGTGRVVDDDAIRLNVGGGSRVVWLMSASVLVAGCTDGEYILSGSRYDDAMTPSGRRGLLVSAYGNADVAPLKIQGPPAAILHVLRSRKVLRETMVAPDQSVESRELSVLPHHIFDRGVAEMAWQQPDNLVWLRLDDGGLAAMTYHMEHKVVGATRQPLPGGWKVESIASTPTPAGGDVVMASVMRMKSGAPQRRIWLLSTDADGVFMDGAALYDGAPATIINVGAHRDGDTVAIIADGGRAADQVVAAGRIVLDTAASRVLIGEKMVRRFESLPLDMEGVGSTNARTIKPTHATVIFSGVEALIGTDEPDSAERVQGRPPGDLSGPVARRQRHRVGLGGGAGRDRRLVIQTDAPFDLRIHAYRLEAETTK